MAKKKTTTRLNGMEKAVQKYDRARTRTKPDPLDEMLKRHHEMLRVARNKAAVVAVLGSLGFEQPGYHVLDVTDLLVVRSRNNIDRPSNYGATIDDLTTTCAVLYHERARAALAVDGLVDSQLDFVSKMKEGARRLRTMRNFLRRVPRAVLKKHLAGNELLEMLDDA